MDASLEQIVPVSVGALGYDFLKAEHARALPSLLCGHDVLVSCLTSYVGYLATFSVSSRNFWLGWKWAWQFSCTV